jgi:thioredoxin 1
MLTPLDSARLDAYVESPGVAIVDWQHPGSAASLILGQILERASQAHEDVRFGTVDVSREAGLAREWEISETPTLSAYRDGVLVFSRPGLMPAAAIEGLIETIWSLDMDEVRRGRDGQRGPVLVALGREEAPSFEIAPPGRGGQDGGAPSGAGRHK